MIMDYDFQGPWDGTGPTNFESNLYESPAAPNTTAEPLISLSSTVKYYEGRGVRSRQLVVGLPYYGHGWTGVPAGSDFGLYQSATGPATSPDMTEAGAYFAGLDGTDPAGTSDYYELAACPSDGVSASAPHQRVHRPGHVRLFLAHRPGYWCQLVVQPEDHDVLVH